MKAGKSQYTLASWFSSVNYTSGPYDDSIREEILGDAHTATAVAVDRDSGVVLAKTGKGVTMMHKSEDGRIVFFHHLGNDGRRILFWMNTSSVKHLGDELRKLPRVPFGPLLTGSSD